MKSIDHTDNIAKQGDIPLTFGDIDSWAKLSVLLVGVIYICGFLTLNSHFYKYGVVELGIASSEYLVAGSIFTLYIVIYGLCGGRAAVLSEKWMNQRIDHLEENNAPPIAHVIVSLHSLVEIAFLHCASAAVFSMFAFEQHEGIRFYVVLLFTGLISHILDITSFDIKYPFADTIIDLILKSFTVYSFFNLSSSVNMFLVLFVFFMYSTYIKLVISGFKRYKITKGGVVWASIIGVMFFLSSAIGFGTVTYGNVSKKLGGGKVVEMEIGLKQDSLGSLTDDFKSPLVVDVIYSSSKNTYIKVDDKIIVLPRSSIQWMRFDVPKEKGLLDSLGLTEKEITR